MKKLSLYIFAILVFGCSEIQPESVDQAKLDGVLNLTGEQQKLAYGTLSDIEKTTIWNQRLESAIKNVYLTPQQKKLVKQLIVINSSIRELNEEKANSVEAAWITKAEKVFTVEQIKSLAFQLTEASDLSNTLSSKIGQEDPSFTNCNCNRGSLYSCDPPTFACPDSPSTCKNPTTWGCGFLFLYPCNQICVVTED